MKNDRMSELLLSIIRVYLRSMLDEDVDEDDRDAAEATMKIERCLNQLRETELAHGVDLTNWPTDVQLEVVAVIRSCTLIMTKSGAILSLIAMVESGKGGKS